MRVTGRRNQHHSGMPYVWTAQVLGHLSGSEKGIMWCRQVTPAIKAEVLQTLKDTQGKKVVTAKRPSDAAATATGLASAAAAVAASKRARSSLSSGPDVGAGGWSGEIGNDARASMALADMIHSEGLSGDSAKKPKMLAALPAFKNTSKTYATPGRKQVDGPLLDALSGQYDAGGLWPDRRVGRGDGASHLAHQRAGRRVHPSATVYMYRNHSTSSKLRS